EQVGPCGYLLEPHGAAQQPVHLVAIDDQHGDERRHVDGDLEADPRDREPEEVLRHDEVSGAGYGEELCEALYHTQDDRFPPRHAEIRCRWSMSKFGLQNAALPRFGPVAWAKIRPAPSAPRRSPAQEVAHHVLTQRHGVREVGLAARHLADLADELDQRPLAREHERVDQDARLPARGYLVQSLPDHPRIEASRILVYAILPDRDRARLAVRDHHDLSHVLLLREQYATRELQPFRRVRVERADLRVRQLADRDLLRAIPEGDHTQCVAG